jgi:hypothetical protein
MDKNDIKKRIADIENRKIAMQKKIALVDAQRLRLERKVSGKEKEWQNHIKYLAGGHLLRMIRTNETMAKLFLDSLGEMTKPGDYPAIADIYESLKIDLERMVTSAANRGGVKKKPSAPAPDTKPAPAKKQPELI